MAESSDTAVLRPRQSAADDRTTWVLVQDESGETRLITQEELYKSQHMFSNLNCLSSSIPVDVTLPIQQGTAVEFIQPSDTHPEYNNNHIPSMAQSGLVSSTVVSTDNEIETLRSHPHDVSNDSLGAVSPVSYNNGSTIELVMDEDLDSSLTNESSILEHISRQIAIQQPYLNPDNGGKPVTYHIEEIPIENVPVEALGVSASLDDGYTLVPTIFSQPHCTWYNQRPQQSVDHRPSSKSRMYEPFTVYTPSNPKKPHVQYLTPTNAQSILQPVGTHESGRYLYTPHPKTGRVYIPETPSPQVVTSKAAKTTATTQTVNLTSTPNSKAKPKSPAPVPTPSTTEKSKPDDKENVSPDSSKDDLDLDFPPMFITAGGEESREQHNLKERKRRARIKDACEVMRKLVPGMSDKTDKATVFEFAARYIHFLKGFTGNKHDKDFLMKYSPY